MRHRRANRYFIKKFDKANFTGIDPSAEMLAKSKAFESSNLSFKYCSVEDFLASGSNPKRDLIFSNTALQWSDNHEALLIKRARPVCGTNAVTKRKPAQQNIN